MERRPGSLCCWGYWLDSCQCRSYLCCVGFGYMSCMARFQLVLLISWLLLRKFRCFSAESAAARWVPPAACSAY
ncbi:hypothetical protein V6N13_082432 [Hibiscus sabdariffa]|uniref:Secreted protein n=1 Tax=Hibiscus sabdariffa TaxID=183260 RepID=A0ABR2Q436_9ROSI